MTVGTPTGFRCDGCGRTSGKLDWNTPQAADNTRSPYMNRPDLAAMYVDKKSQK